MGFFDRFAAKKATTPPPAAPESSEVELAPSPTAASSAGIAVKPQLAAAREKLEARDLPGAMGIYEELLRVAGDRADVLVALSGDLGSCGYVEQIVELVAPRYDAERHGPATGLNLLQAYLATHNTEAAQHLLDILFALNRPELEQRLHGFSNALAELMESERRGTLARPPANGESASPDQASPGGDPANFISLASISKPIWSYGIETVPGILPTKSEKLRRVAFAQLALLDLPDVLAAMKQPENELGRFCRGFPLWLAETFYFAPHYSPLAAIGTMNKEHYALFGSEWTTANIRQLIETSSSNIDYVFTGTLRDKSGDFELVLKVWEVKRFRERKAFTVRWTPATADAELTKLSETVRMFMEWTAYPAGTALTYSPAAHPFAYCEALGSSLSLFLSDKGVLPKTYLEPVTSILPRLALHAADSEIGALAYLTAIDRAARLELVAAPTIEGPLFSSPAVDQAKAFLTF